MTNLSKCPIPGHNLPIELKGERFVSDETLPPVAERKLHKCHHGVVPIIKDLIEMSAHDEQKPRCWVKYEKLYATDGKGLDGLPKRIEIDVVVWWQKKTNNRKLDQKLCIFFYVWRKVEEKGRLQSKQTRW